MSQLELKLDSKSYIGTRRVVASVSGGRDSAAMSLYLHELGIEHDRVFMDTGWEHPITYDYLRGPLTKALGPIVEIRGQLDFLALVRRKGLFSSRVMRFCTTELKVLPAQRYIASLGVEVVNAVGIRRAESRARSQSEEWEWSDTFDCEVWRPIARWSADQVDAIHRRHGLAPNPLYAWGLSRVGCWPCIHARKSEIAIVAERDPRRIDEIEATEQELNDAGSKRDEAMGRAFMRRSMFSYGGGGRGHVALPIRAAVDWARSARGEWQPYGGDGCARYGLCESEPSEAA